MVYIGASKQRCISWTPPHYELLIEMQSKFNKNSSNRVSKSSSLKICQNRSMEKETLNHTRKDISTRNFILNIASPRHRKRRVMRSLRKTPKSGVSSTKSLGTKIMNVAQKTHWWSISKKNNEK
jgi:hypothetical protein